MGYCASTEEANLIYDRVSKWWDVSLHLSLHSVSLLSFHTRSMLSVRIPIPQRTHLSKFMQEKVFGQTD